MNVVLKYEEYRVLISSYCRAMSALYAMFMIVIVLSSLSIWLKQEKDKLYPDAMEYRQMQKDMAEFTRALPRVK